MELNKEHNQANKPESHGRSELHRVSPKADIYETKDAFGISLEVPGVSQEQLEVSVEKEFLVVESRPEGRQLSSCRHRNEGEARCFCACQEGY